MKKFIERLERCIIIAKEQWKKKEMTNAITQEFERYVDEDALCPTARQLYDKKTFFVQCERREDWKRKEVSCV